MKRVLPFFVLLLMVGCGSEKAASTKSAGPKDPKMAAIQDRIDKTTSEGRQMIEKVRGLKPEVNDQPSGKTLGEMVDIYSKEKGAYNIIPIGWEAAQKKSGRWKVAFSYQDWQKQYLTAEWEYNPESGKLYPFEFDNAKGFWAAPEGPVKKGKKS